MPSSWILPRKPVYELSSLTGKSRADQGAVLFLVLADVDPTWQTAKGMWVLLPSLVLVKWHWANSLTAQGLGQGTHNAKSYPLPRSNTQKQQAPACLYRESEAEDEQQKREQSIPRLSECCWLHPFISGSKAGNRSVDVSPVRQVSYHPASLLICSSDVSCAPKRP